MPWKETCIMDERMKFVGRILSGEKMACVCKEFGISRVAGYKIWNRYQEYGAKGVYDQSRAPMQVLNSNEIYIAYRDDVHSFKATVMGWR